MRFDSRFGVCYYRDEGKFRRSPQAGDYNLEAAAPAMYSPGLGYCNTVAVPFAAASSLCRRMGTLPRKGTAVEEQHVRITIKGPALATLILAGWLELQGTPEAQAAEKQEAGGTIELFSETAEYWLELPCSLVYDITAEPGVRRGALSGFRRLNARSNGASIPTYLLRLVVAGPE